MQRVGMGYDIHRLKKGRKLILGGVEIPYALGLDGHSDADILLHAICDALLGAAGEGDIGEHFPNTDEAYRNISSVVLLSRVKDLLAKKGFRVSSIDSVILAEEPKLQPFKDEMRSVIAKTLSIKKDQINIKATTQEGVGFGVREEAMAAYAVALCAKEESP
ncbi:MAG: 2-C-methyl-D-erythritol 2,4-cyclodiphosphate synthase [Candidatus Omnitrophota bacterium]